ncbi:hypothetical protein MRBLWH7_000337 [Microbacterium sp. LWH7-1.2]|uniref:hypothetical protein n=1 Tax=Microbacterium sp. LWH7-1.2 TaxID=3135257 RepID=UPI00313A3E62
MNPTPSPSASLLEGAVATLPSWDAWATLGAAIIAAVLAGISVGVTKRASARDNAITRFNVALDSLDSDKHHRVEFGLSVLKSMRKSKWLDDDDRKHAVATLRAYNRPKSKPGGAA